MFLAVLLAALAWGLLAPRSAGAKGPVVRAPAELRPDDCAPGSRPPLGNSPGAERYYRGLKVLVVGCTEMGGAARVLVAAERRPAGRGQLVCWYVAPEGTRDIGDRCNQTRGRFTRKEPLTGGAGISTPTIRRGGRAGGTYVYGQASPELASVVVSYRTESGAPRESVAELVPIGPGVARRLDARGPFSYFVGEVPAQAETCRGIAVEGRDRRGHAVERQSLKPSAARFNRPRIPLPGAESAWSPFRGVDFEAECRGREPLRSSIAETIWLRLSGWRSLATLNPIQVAEVLQVDVSTVEGYRRRGLLPSIEGGGLHWFTSEDVEALCRVHRGCEA